MGIIYNTFIIKIMAIGDKVIKSIRYYGSYSENINGKSVSIPIGNLFDIKKISAIGDRIARKLNEYNFVSGIFDHVYIIYSTSLPDGEIKMSNRHTEKWFLELDMGISADNLKRMTDSQKEEFITQCTFKCLAYLYKDNKEKIDTIKKVEEEVRKFGKELEIIYSIKETRSYLIKIYYKIKPKGDPSYAFIEYHDKKSGMQKQTILELQFYEDIYPLIGSVSVKGGKIILKPKSSFKATLYNKRYKTPISIDISEMNKTFKKADN